MRSAALLVLLAACSKDERTPPPKATPKLEHATQADFARELDAAEQRGNWIELRRRWQGQKLRWTVYRHPALCGSADACNVRAFPTTAKSAAYGWMPELHFAAGQYEALAAKCGSEQCEVTIEGTLAKLEANGDTPTNLKFEGVTIAKN
jgi:hypothetical protein